MRARDFIVDMERWHKRLCHNRRSRSACVISCIVSAVIVKLLLVVCGLVVGVQG